MKNDFHFQDIMTFGCSFWHIKTLASGRVVFLLIITVNSPCGRLSFYSFNIPPIYVFANNHFAKSFSPGEMIKHLPELRRRTVIDLLKRPVKGRQAGKAGLQRHIHNGKLWIFQQLRCP